MGDIRISLDWTEVGLYAHFRLLFLCVLPILDNVLAKYLTYIIAIAVGLSRQNYMLQVMLVFTFV